MTIENKIIHALEISYRSSEWKKLRDWLASNDFEITSNRQPLQPCGYGTLNAVKLLTVLPTEHFLQTDTEATK